MAQAPHRDGTGEVDEGKTRTRSKRQCDRHGVSTPCRLKRFDVTGHQRAQTECVLLDASFFGFQLRTPVRLAIGERIELTCNGQTVQAVVRSAMFHQGEWRCGCQFAVGLEFLSAAGVAVDELTNAYNRRTALEQREAWEPLMNFRAAADLAINIVAACDFSIGRNLKVKDAIADCTFDVDGDVIASRIVGGSACVAGSIKVDELGSPDGRKTILRLGQSRNSMLLLRELEPALLDLRSELDRHQESVDFASSPAAANMAHSEREQVTIAACRVEELRAQIARMEANSKRLIEREAWPRSNSVTVARAIHPGVCISAGNSSKVFADVVVGPITIQLDAAGELHLTHPETSPNSATPNAKAA